MVTATKTHRPSTPRKPANGASFAKKVAKPNASILNFFQKTQKHEESLFVGAVPETTTQDEDLYGADDDQHRFNESDSPVKKRRLSDERHTSVEMVEGVKTTPSRISPSIENRTQDGKPKPRIQLPFIMDSDSEHEDEDDLGHRSDGPHVSIAADRAVQPSDKITIKPHEAAGNAEPECRYELPPLKQEESTVSQLDELGEFAGPDDLGLDEFEGEEMRERRFMREQARLEAEEMGTLLGDDFGEDPLDDSSMTETCPICNGSLAGISTDDATRHVNSCLDGNFTPLPKREKSQPIEVAEVESAEIGRRFARAAVPRPGQANPFELGGNDKPEKSAFSKLMSNKAEDSAWASAAAAEHASRGRPAYERTCPFYKIIPGFNICVDAFRYGAVKGCEAYFLSHFHSDHYIGLTASWRHGPIYCSKVTGSLVKQQLRTASKWVVELEFEKSYDIPGTGATVTMIPANHCPGSSLFLFQKPLEKGPSKRTQRVLHCGDFRACPEHVGHPLLKPDVVDSITGKTKQQTINMCYLDTTYLNPRYSFPPQDDVIKACADLCASMSPDPNCEDDIWERSTRAGGTPAVSKYFQSDRAVEEASASKDEKKRLDQRLLVICGTYSIGKERICIAIANALGSKIFATPQKMKICKQLDDPELASLLTSNPLEAQVHMQSLMEIRAETLQDYLSSYKPHFSRIVGFRPSGWNFRLGAGKSVGANTSPSSIPTDQLLHGKNWRTRFVYKDFVTQRGSTKEAMCFGVPYSEHSSFRELAMFLMCLRIERVIPTVNVGSEQSRKRMRGWIDRWTAERRRGGLLRPLIEGHDEEDHKAALWDGKPGKGGGAWW